MNLVKFQDIKLMQKKNILHSYILTTKCQKEKLRKQSHLPLQQWVRHDWATFTLLSNLPMEAKELSSDTDERNQRQHKKMERYTTFLDWKKSILWKWWQYPKETTDSMQYLSNYAILIKLCNPYQILIKNPYQWRLSQN